MSTSVTAQPLRVLQVEDDPFDARLVLDELGQAGYVVQAVRAETEAQFLAALDPPPDVVLCDYTLPQFDARRVLELTRGRCPWVPVLIVSGTIEDETAVEVMRAGADDYLLKDRLGRLGPAVGAALERGRLRQAERAARAALAASEARHRELVESIPGLVWTATPDGQIDFLNHWGAEVLGVPPGTIAGLGWVDLVHPDEAARARADWMAAVAAGAPFRSEHRLRTVGGGYRWFLTQARPVRGAGGVVEQWVGTATDIDAQKRAEEELRLRDRAMQAASQGVIITDPHRPDNPIVYASPGFERLTGYPAAEVVGRNCRFLQGPDTDPAAVAALRAAVRDGRSCSVEMVNYRNDGRPFWNLVAVAPVCDAGRLTHFIGVQTDVTERRRLEDQFRQAQKMEAVGQLAGGVAHDFNNLLTVIVGFSELLLDGLSAGSPERRLVEAIRDAGQRAAGLTAQLLAFSRQTVVEPRVIDLGAAVRAVAQMLGRLIGEDIALEVRPGHGLPPVRIDPGLLDQVVMNLAVNARDAMPRGGRLTLATDLVEVPPGDPARRAGRYARLTVHDTGEGMTDEVRARVFEPFFTTKGVGKGTGLGLAMVYGVVHQAGGYVGVTSEVGRGTTFEVLLPAVEGEAGGPAEVDDAAPGGGTETVLLVEDEEEVRHLARLVLEARGYEVLTAADGVAGLAKAGEAGDRLALVVTDVVMPRMGGRELATALRAARPGLRVLYVTGYTVERLTRDDGLGPADAVLQKPYTPTALARKVRAVLDGG